MKPILQSLEMLRQSTLLLVRHRMITVVLVIVALETALLPFLPARAARQAVGDELYGLFTYLAWIQLGLPFLGLFFGVTAIHQDLEDRTATYLFLRPVPRWSLLVGKWLGASLVTACLVAIPVLTTWASFAWTPRPWRAGLGPTPMAPLLFVVGIFFTAPAYAAIGILAGACFKRPLILTLGYMVGLEVFVSNLPPRSGVRGLTVADPLRRWLVEYYPEAPRLVEILTQRLGREAATLGTAPGLALARATAIALLVALWFYTRREYDSRPRD